MSGGALAVAFRLLQQGDAAEALRRAAAIAADEPSNARAHLAAGMALRALGRGAEARRALETAEALAPRDYAAPFELGVLLDGQRLDREALACYDRAIALRPEFAPARFASGALLDRMGRAGEAIARYEETLERDPAHVGALRVLGQRRARRGEFARAGELFAAAATLAPGDPDLPLYAAQALLLAGRWNEAWRLYGRRDSRIAFEARLNAAGRAYRVPAAAELSGKDVALVAEQGLGDNLFFLRFAPALRASARRVGFRGEPRLDSILARTGAVDAAAGAPEGGEVPVLVADLPVVMGAAADIFAPTLRAAPEPGRLARWKGRLAAAGPRPWIAATWRSGTPRAASREALSKSVPLEGLFRALAGWPGTVFALQRGILPGELAHAAAALGRPVHDLSGANDALEDALAVVAIVDRHVGVSSTNMHLAAMAGATADVLVPFPPEWRWRAAGDSPWFPGFRVLRQDVDGSWAGALAALEKAR
jgi:Flp pilus assembly protein TadD